MNRKTILLLTAVTLAAAPLAGGQIVGYRMTTLAVFNGTDGRLPGGGLYLDAHGNLYGTAEYGGANGDGTIFELAAGSHTPTTLVNFNGTNDDGGPATSLTCDPSGNFYGATALGGAYGCGTVFELPFGSNSVTTLATFNGINGETPISGLLRDPQGNLYGTTEWGGPGFTSPESGYGTVFEIPFGSQTVKTLVNFNDSNGQECCGNLISDASGNLYGTTYQGGPNECGTVFMLAAGTHALSTVATFNGTDGAEPGSQLAFDARGNLYGTTDEGGANQWGTVFEIPAGTNTVKTLASFNGSKNGDSSDGVICDANGDLFGTCGLGGNSYYIDGGGTAFELAAGSNVITPLVDFDGTNGEFPSSGLILDASGNLYGTTGGGLGGAGNYGTIFELSPIYLPDPATGSLLIAAAGMLTHRRRKQLAQTQ
jgi:uncharacterized repeat protein (TIGR03803 family)